jgi:hypothetical protein
MDLAIKLSLVAVCIFIFWRTFKMIKANPGIFTKESLGKTFMTLGVLSLALIAFVAFLVFSIRKG